MLVGVKIKQPDERLDYDFDYTKWFDNNGDAIDTVQVDVIPSGGMSAVNALVTPGDQGVKVWCEGGSDGDIYTVEVTITSVVGRVKQDELEIRIQEF